MQYQTSHPWIDFQIEPDTIPPALWMLLGEAQSKCEHIAGVPLEPPVAGQLERMYLVRGVRATTAIEGNTLSEEQIDQNLDGALRLPPSQDYLRQEVENITRAWYSIREELPTNSSVAVSVDEILEYNAMILKDLPLAKGITPGKVRTHGVGVGMYRGAPADECEYLLRTVCDWLGEISVVPEGNTVAAGILRAILAHLYLAWIHPFSDGNGRTARLVELKLLLASGVPVPAAHLLSDHYNRTRTEYYRYLERASIDRNGAVQFVEYAIRGFVDGLKEQLGVIRSYQYTVAWREYVYRLFGNRKTKTALRQRTLVLALGEQPADSEFELENLSKLSIDVYDQYNGVSIATLRRDVEELLRMELAVKRGKYYRANTGIIEAFLPE